MKVGIIGGGFTGLSAAFELSNKGIDVDVIETLDRPGGLAAGFADSGWDWNLDYHYHHIFTSDNQIINLSKLVDEKIIFNRPKTATYINGKIAQLDSPYSLICFSELTILSRIRTAIGLALLKYNPFWRPFEKFTAKSYIKNIMGEESWIKLWEPLFIGKFGDYSNEISAAWFWSRIYKRSPDLGYPEKGFAGLLEKLVNSCVKKGCKIIYNSEVVKISSKSNNKITLLLNDGTSRSYDKVICTLSTHQLNSICPDSVDKLENLPYLGAINVVIKLKNTFFEDGTYWLNVNDRSFPFLAVVEHTNFMDRRNYNNDTLLYVGNYLQKDHEFFKLNSNQLVEIFYPYLKKINPKLKKTDILKSWSFKAKFAQPVITKNYSKKIPKMMTNVKNLYLANMQQVYPWDRGTNYAVELGIKVGKICAKD